MTINNKVSMAVRKRKLRSFVDLFFVGLFFFIPVFYNNCSPDLISFSQYNSKAPNSGVQTGGSGEGYLGKPDPGEYTRFNPDFNCKPATKPFVQGEVTVTSDQLILKTDNCNITDFPMSVSDPQIDSRAYNKDYFGLYEAIFRSNLLSLESLPEYFCRNYNDDFGIDVVVEMDPQSQKNIAKIYFGENKADGSLVTEQSSWFDVSRSGTTEFAANNFLINIDSAKSGPIFYNARLATLFNGRQINSDLSCRQMGPTPVLPNINVSPLLFKNIGETAGSYYGGNSARLADLNNDGIADFAVSAARFSVSGTSENGKLYFYSGADNTLMFTKVGVSREWLSHVNTVGDFDGDGVSEFITSGYHNSTKTTSGRVDVYSGASRNLLYTLNGEGATDQFGITISPLGDVNGDGKGDFVVGSPKFRVNGDPTKEYGKIYVYSGASGVEIYSKIGNAPNSAFGYDVTVIGDLDKDGKQDFLVSQAQYKGWGKINRIFIFSGASGNEIGQISALAAGDEFALSAFNAGDVNNDGYNDILASSNTCATPSNCGRAFVFSGKDRSVLFSTNGSIAGQSLGAHGGDFDFNGDGIKDFALGYRPSTPQDSSKGKLEIYSGKDFKKIYEQWGEAEGDYFGAGLENFGDHNGDGKDDLIVSAYHHISSLGDLTGQATIIKGR